MSTPLVKTLVDEQLDDIDAEQFYRSPCEALKLPANTRIVDIESPVALTLREHFWTKDVRHAQHNQR